MSLKQAVLHVHSLLTTSKIEHALIGGLALAVHGINRATGDIDLLIDESDKEKVKQIFKQDGFALKAETPEVLHFSGIANVDFLLARRPLSRQMLQRAQPSVPLNIKCLEPEDIIGLKIQAYTNNPKRALQDKADIQFLMDQYPNMDFQRVKSYADLFGKWLDIEQLRIRK